MTDEMRAVFRLIAAAPLMLAALEAIDSVRPDNWDDADDLDQVEAWSFVSAAILQANGDD